MKKHVLLLFIFMWMSTFQCLAYESNKIDIHGFISQGYMKSYYYEYLAGMIDGTFNLNEMGINFSTRPSKQLRIGLQLFSRKLGDIGNDKVTIDWAFADYYFHKWLGIRVGRIKSPMGLYNETRDVDAVRTGVFLNQSIYNDLFRDSVLAIDGFGIYGEITGGRLGSFNYQAQIGDSEFDTDSGTAKGIIGITNIDVITEINYKYAYNLALKWATPLPGLLLGITDFYGKLEMQGWLDVLYGKMTYDPYEVLVYSIEYATKKFVFVTEYLRWDIHYTAEAQNFEMSPYRDVQNILAWYSSISYRFLPWLEGALAYSEFYDNADDRDGKKRERTHDYKAWQKDVTLSLRFDINENWILKLEDHIVGGCNQVLRQNNSNFSVEHWNMWAAKLSFTF